MKLQTEVKMKFKMLGKSLGLCLWETIGVLEAVWHFTIKYAPRGNIGRFSDTEIAAGIEWSGDASELIGALAANGWLDPDDEYRLLVHDWREHCPMFLRGNLKSRGIEFATSSPPGSPAKAKPKPEAAKAQAAPEALAEGDDLIEREKRFVVAWNALEGVAVNRGPTLSAPRRQVFRTRLKSPGWVELAGKALKKFPLKCFADQSRWKPNIGWFLRPGTVDDILDGKFDWTPDGNVVESGPPEAAERYGEFGE